MPNRRTPDPDVLLQARSEGQTRYQAVVDKEQVGSEGAIWGISFYSPRPRTSGAASQVVERLAPLLKRQDLSKFII